MEFAVESARRAGELTLRYFRKNPRIETKADNTPVTEADRGAEALLRECITQQFPTHAILGEELGEHVGSAPARWILDPIDGTFSFICGVPLYSTLIGLEWAGEMVLGVIHLPAIGQTVWAARGEGCWIDGTPARVSTTTDLSAARLSTTSSTALLHSNREAGYQRLRRACRVDRGWPDAYAYVLLATGQVDVVLDPIMSVWDTAALWPVVTEAGGTLTDWSGRPTHTAPEALGTNGRLLEAVLKHIAPQ